VAGEIAAGRAWSVHLIYVHPEFDGLVRRVRGMRVVAEAEIAFSDEDAVAEWCFRLVHRDDEKADIISGTRSF
jgi:hypothetical protein